MAVSGVTLRFEGVSYLRTKQAAEVARVSVSWLLRRSRLPGGPPFIRRGLKILWPEKELREWANRKEIE